MKKLEIQIGKKQKPNFKLTSLESISSGTGPTDVDRFKTDSSNFTALLMGLPTGKKNPLKFEQVPVEEQFGKGVKLFAQKSNPTLILSEEDEVILPSKFEPFLLEMFRQMNEKKELEESGLTPDLYIYMDQKGVFKENLRVISDAHKKVKGDDGKITNSGAQTTGNPIDKSNFKKYKDAFFKALSQDILIGGEVQYKETAKNKETGKEFLVERTKKIDKPFTILQDSVVVDDVKVIDKETGKTYFKGRRVCYPINPVFWDIFKSIFIPMCLPLGVLFIQGKKSLNVMYFLYRHRRINPTGPMKISELCRLVGLSTKYSKTNRGEANHFLQDTRKPLEEILRHSLDIGLKNYTLKDSSGNVMTTETPNDVWIKGYIHYRTLVKPNPSSIAIDGEKELDFEEL